MRFVELVPATALLELGCDLPLKAEHPESRCELIKNVATLCPHTGLCGRCQARREDATGLDRAHHSTAELVSLILGVRASNSSPIVDIAAGVRELLARLTLEVLRCR